MRETKRLIVFIKSEGRHIRGTVKIYCKRRRIRSGKDGLFERLAIICCFGIRFRLYSSKMSKVQITFYYSQPRTQLATNHNWDQPNNPSTLNSKKIQNLVISHVHCLTPPRSGTPLKPHRPSSLDRELPIESNQKTKPNLNRINSSDLHGTFQPSSSLVDDQDDLSNHSQEFDQPLNQQFQQVQEKVPVKAPQQEEQRSKLTKSQTKKILIEKYQYAGLLNYTSKKQHENEEIGIFGCCECFKTIRAPNYEIED